MRARPRDLSLKIMIDAADQLETGDKTAQRKGIYPQLAALEALVYPQSQQVKEMAKLVQKGQIEVGIRYDAPLTLFVWGPARVVPVTIQSFSITEQAFDSTLNPIRAEMDISLKALSYDDVHPDHKAHKLFLTYQQNKEKLPAMRRHRMPTRWSALTSPAEFAIPLPLLPPH